MKWLINLLPALLVFSLLQTRPAWCQSFYSQEGIGLTHYFVSGQAAGMGGVGLATRDPLSVNYLNPAALTNLSVTFISGNFLHEVNTLDGDASAAITNTNVDGLMFHIPIKALQVSTAIGLVPYSSIEYAFEAEGFVNGDSYRQVISGDGGVNTAFASFAVRPIPRISVGVTGLYYFGRLRQITRIIFDETSFRPTRVEVSENFTAGNARFGVQAGILPDWTVGAVFSPSITLDANKTVTLRNIREFSDFQDRDIKLPFSYGFGTSFFVGRKLMVGADYYVEEWGDINSEGYVNNSRRFGLGLEFSGRGRSLNSSYISRAAFRLGFSYKDLGIEEPTGERVTEVFGSAGLGLPIKWSAARLDLSLQVGQRGSVESNPIRERVVRFSATITAGEKWFYRGGTH